MQISALETGERGAEAKLLQESMELNNDSSVSVMVQAGPNRSFNADAGVELARQIQSVVEPEKIQVVARADDVEIWSDEAERFASMRYAERLANVQQATRGNVMDAIPLLREMEDALEALDIPLEVICQPESNSYTEGYWTSFGGEGCLAPPSHTTNIIQTASSRSLQQRLMFGLRDGHKSGEAPDSLRDISCFRHREINSRSEMISLCVARLIRTFLGPERYVDFSLGEGPIGSMYKRIQQIKIDRARRLTK